MAMFCTKCGEGHPTVLCRYSPEVAARKLGLFSQKPALTATRARPTVSRYYAPPGTCGFCDARREASREGMKKLRGK